MESLSFSVVKLAPETDADLIAEIARVDPTWKPTTRAKLDEPTVKHIRADRADAIDAAAEREAAAIAFFDDLQPAARGRYLAEPMSRELVIPWRETHRKYLALRQAAETMNVPADMWLASADAVTEFVGSAVKFRESTRAERKATTDRNTAKREQLANEAIDKQKAAMLAAAKALVLSRKRKAS